jgi:hypothetical protein
MKSSSRIGRIGMSRMVFFALLLGFPVPLLFGQLNCFSDHFSGSGLLAVDLVFFSVEKSGENNKLKWTTAREWNNRFFFIEKSIDGWDYEMIGVKESAGFSEKCSNYVWIDENVNNVYNHYRIKFRDSEGMTGLLDNLFFDERAIFKEQEISKIIDLFGHEVSEEYRGIVINLYVDGSSVKVIQ